jgi:hypothetical protein
MNRRYGGLVIATALLLALSLPADAQMQSRIGVGVHYWKALKDVDASGIDEDGLGWMISYKLVPSSLLSFQADLELLPDGYAGAAKQVLAPQILAVAGKSFYGAVGIGTLYSDGDFADDPFYALRAGVDLEILPRLFADINVNYWFEQWDFTDVKQDVSMDTLTLGAVVRLQL